MGGRSDIIIVSYKMPGEFKMCQPQDGQTWQKKSYAAGKQFTEK
jgi:hypothetical protein